MLCLIEIPGPLFYFKDFEKKNYIFVLHLLMDEYLDCIQIMLTNILMLPVWLPTYVRAVGLGVHQLVQQARPCHTGRPQGRPIEADFISMDLSRTSMLVSGTRQPPIDYLVRSRFGKSELTQRLS